MREKIESLEELKAKGLYIIEEDDATVENHIAKILEEKGLLVSDLAKLTGISRQNINAVVKGKMKPGVDFALKVSYVLGMSVEELFTLTENAWVKPYKQERDANLYLDIVKSEIIDNTAKKEAMAENGYEYFNQESQEYLTKVQRDKLLKEYLEAHTPDKVKEMKGKFTNLSMTRINSLAKDELRKEFGSVHIKIYKKLAEKIHPYVINSKKVVRNRE